MAEPHPDGCQIQRDQAAAFVLGDLDASQWADMVAHLSGCPTCRAEVASLASAIDALSEIVPPMEPSAGFTERVLAGGPTETELPVEDRGPRPRRHRRGGARRRHLTVLTAAAALVVVVGIGVAVAGRRTSPPATARHPVAVADLRTGAGGGVGQAVVFGQRSAQITVGLDVANGTDPTYDDGNYNVFAVLRDGHRVPIGHLVVADGRGGMQAATALQSTDITTIKVQSPTGADLCAGLLPPPPR